MSPFLIYGEKERCVEEMLRIFSEIEPRGSNGILALLVPDPEDSSRYLLRFRILFNVRDYDMKYRGKIDTKDIESMWRLGREISDEVISHGTTTEN